MLSGVLIVDDEQFIRQGLKTLVDWNSAGYRLVGEAATGEEAFNKILDLKPDLCVIDIRMPIMDGLSVIEKCHGIGSNTRFIILSGYSEFEYAKRAMAMGIMQYVLKPIDPALLLEKLIEERKIIMDKRKNRELKWQQDLKTLMRQEHKSVAELSHICGEKLPWRYYQVFIIEGENEINEAVFLDIKKHLDRHVFFYREANRLICLKKDRPYRSTKSLENMLRWIEKKHLCKLLIAIGHSVENVVAIKNSYEQAVELLNKRFVFDEKEILTPSLVQSKESVNQSDTKDVLESLVSGIQFNDMKKMNDCMERFFNSQVCKGFDEETIIANYVHLYVTLMNQFSETTQMELSHFRDLVKQKGLKRLHGYVKLKCVELGHKRFEETMQDPISKLKWMIQERYQQPLRLEDLADEIGYNSAYLGKQFKIKTGQNFNYYLDKLRIRKSKELLASSDLKIYEIAEAVGYQNADYFTLRFKKYEYCSPKQYRLDIRNEE